MHVADCSLPSLLFAMPGVNPDSSAALYPPPFSRSDDSNGASTSASTSASVSSTTNTAAATTDAQPADSQPVPFSASAIASLFPSLHRSTSLSAHPAAVSSTSAPSSSLSPFLSRQLTTSRPSSTSASSSSSDWRTSVTIEDRLQQRSKLRDAYSRQSAGSLSVLLELVQAVEEELLFAGSGSRLDYFKAAIDYEARLRIKKQQLGLASAGPLVEGTAAATGTGAVAESGAVKRERQDGEQHEKEARDKLEETAEGEEEDSGDAVADAVEVDSEPSIKKQRS